MHCMLSLFAEPNPSQILRSLCGQPCLVPCPLPPPPSMITAHSSGGYCKAEYCYSRPSLHPSTSAPSSPTNDVFDACRRIPPSLYRLLHWGLSPPPFSHLFHVFSFCAVPRCLAQSLIPRTISFVTSLNATTAAQPPPPPSMRDAAEPCSVTHAAATLPTVVARWRWMKAGGCTRKRRRLVQSTRAAAALVAPSSRSSSSSSKSCSSRGTWEG